MKTLKLRMGNLQGTDGERGSIAPLLVGFVLVIVSLGILLVVPFGHALVDKRTASTAADAAALAAVDSWRTSLESVHTDVLEAADEEELWTPLGRSLRSYATSDMRRQAAEFAARNDGVLVEMTVDGPAREVSVRVRSAEPHPSTGNYTYSTATARIDIDRGLCVRNGLVGVRIDGTCKTRPDPRAPEPEIPIEEDPAAPVEPEPEPPFELPDGLDATFSATTTLVDN